MDLPAGVSATPYFIPLVPPLPDGQTRCVTVALSGLGTHTNLCFRLMAHSPDFAQCCIIEHCVAVAPTPLRIVCPEAITVPCATNGGAFVNYAMPTVVTGSCPVVSLNCTPVSGSFFAAGVHTVNCLGVDAAGRPAPCSFQVTVSPCTIRTNCCEDCVEPFPLSVTVTVQPGYNFLVNPFCHGTNNTVGTILPAVPQDSLLIKWDQARQAYTDPIVFDAALPGWVDGATANDASHTPLLPGEGFVLLHPGTTPFTLTFTGCEPVCPLPCGPTNGFQLVGRVGVGPGSWTNLYSCPPECGATVSVFDAARQSSDDYIFFNGAWAPATPMWPAGAAVFVFVQPNMPCPDPCVTNMPGMIAWWRAETNTVDSAGASHGTLRNGATYGSGHVGGAFQFDGVNDYMDAGNPVALQLTGPFTMEAWVSPGQYPSVNPVVLAGKPFGYQLDLMPGGQVRFAVPVAPGVLISVDTIGAIPLGAFTHVTATYGYGPTLGSRRLDIYVNCVLNNSLNDSGLPVVADPGTPFQIGGFHAPPSFTGGFFKGRIDELSVYDRVLTECDILAICEAGAQGPLGGG